jgi:hypothetical protein
MPNNTENNPNITPVSTQKDELTNIEIREHITRADVRADKDKIFLFGDNLAQRGFGGQAKEMRGEENAVGIPTKKLPSNSKDAFFTDKEFAANKKAIDEAFSKIPPDKTVVMPKAGLGTGLAQLSEKAPKTFTYLNQKLAEIGFNNPNRETAKNLAPKSTDENKVIVQTVNGETPTAKRLLDLNNIQTASLKVLSPTEREIDALKVDSRQSLADYADRLRLDYKSNKDNFRDGLRLLSDSLEKGEQITVACSCRNGAMCHADVVKMAVEKVNAHLKSNSINKENRNVQAENLAAVQENSRTKQINQGQNFNPRTQKAINEILSFSENDRFLEKINETDGRNRNEQASYLGQFSQFTRDVYERGAHIVDGNLIVPQEKLTDSQPLAMTTESYAVDRIGKVLQNEERAKELAPVVVEYGNKIAGMTADGETKLKVFGWMYESLEGKTDFGARETGEKLSFAETLEKIKGLAEEMHSLEPLDKTEFVPLAEIEHTYSAESFTENKGDNLNPAEIYEEAINLETAQQLQVESFELEPSGKINTEGFERIELRADVPRIPEDYTKTEISKLTGETLPEIDRQLENGMSLKEILAPFNEAVRQSASEDAQKRLESIYQKQQNNRTETPPTNQSLEQQPAKIDLRRQNILELKSPNEYLLTEKEAINTFYRQQKLEIGNLLTKIDEFRLVQKSEKTEENTLKKELNQIKEAKPNFAFKLENSAEIVVGFPSQESVETRNFVSSYINYQLKQPETRLRFENARYRDFAVRLEFAATRDSVMKTSGKIRAENAELGFKWKDLKNSEKEKIPRPLTSKEMQFLFTESSPAHYTNEMTAARLSFAHSGASRRAITESLQRGEIKPSPEANKLIESLESRLQRRDIKDSLLATRHFFESIKTPNDSLKYKNSFDHREIYQKLPSQEKDFVYGRATQQKENLEYRLAFKNERFQRKDEINLSLINKQETGEKEKSFHILSQFNQARILGSKIESPSLTQKEISETNVKAITVLLKNQPLDKLQVIGQELQKSQNIENKTTGEVLQTFARADISQAENKTNITIKLPENELVSTETYRELLEKFYPDDTRENEQYKFENFNDKEISRAREKGQDEALQTFREEIKDNIYQKDDSGKVIEIETAVHEKLDKIAQFQSEARNALRENEGLTNKYVARANAKMQTQNQGVPSLINQKKIVSAALSVKSLNLDQNKANDQFLQAVQKEITITDLNKFTANENVLGEMKANIKREFAAVSESLKVLEENKLKFPQAIEPAERTQNLSNKITNQELAENKPVSLRIFEKELEKTEKQMLGASLKEKLTNDVDLEKNFDPNTVFSTEERAEIKSKAIEAVREKLEPKELNADNRKISPEASRQAFATYKQLEKATNLWQIGDDKSKITEAFSKLDREAVKLNQTRQDYNRNEKIALLRDGIKTDLMDWLKKTPDSKQNNFEGQVNKILMNNLNKTKFVKIAGDGKQVGILSRQIVEKIEAKQIFATKEKGMSADSRESVNSAKNNYSFKNDQAKTNLFEKVKDAPVLTR